MALGKTAIKGGIAALMVAMMTAGAFAWEAYATSPLNVRSGPGTNYSVIASLQRNQVVDVQYCRSGWCFLDTGRYGRTGWASQNYPPRPPHWGYPRPPHWNPGPPPRPQPPSSQVCFNGPNGYFCIGN